MNPFKIVKDFEEAVADFTGAPFAVAVNSCTNALFLTLMWHKKTHMLPREISIPRRTYISVPMQIMHVGSRPVFRNEDWEGVYQLAPLPIWDCARRFRGTMYDSGAYLCTSHHWTKPLGISQGGFILHDNKQADTWFRRARFDGRGEGIPPVEGHLQGYRLAHDHDAGNRGGGDGSVVSHAA
jgi:dTDP-4-amino-4,6-dideoxygalactose transaminase